MGSTNAASKNEGLSLGYRFSWRVRHIMMGIFGPAQLGEDNDPRRKLEKERAARVAKAQEARGSRDAA